MPLILKHSSFGYNLSNVENKTIDLNIYEASRCFTKRAGQTQLYKHTSGLSALHAERLSIVFIYILFMLYHFLL